MNLREYMKENILLFDGAMGTMLQMAGLPTGGLPEVYNIEKPNVVLDIHKAYVDAGCDVVTANTFQANAYKLKDCGYSLEEIIKSGVTLARQSGGKYVALDIGPLGQLMKPMGVLSFEEAYEMFKAQIIAGQAAGADVILIETMSDLLEAKAAVIAAKENSSLPIFVTMTYQEDGRTFVGCDPESTAVTLSALGVDALGVNCSLGPKELEPIVDKLLSFSKVPLMVQPNAGLPRIQNGKTIYDITPDEYGVFMEALEEKGVRIMGGCCGTTPEFIKAVRKHLSGKAPKTIEYPRYTGVSSGTKTVIFDHGITVIGERINPTGKKLLKEKLRSGDFGYIMGEAITQTQNGADVLDVNCGLPDIDEGATLKKAVEEIQSVCNLPLQIDSSDAKAIEMALRIYNGKPIINSVNGKKESMDLIFPLVKKYGASVVALTLDESGIPETAQGRLEIARKIVKEAEKYDIPKEDIIVDCLVLTASAQQELVMETLNAIKLVKSELNVKTVLGVSNVSFGLPARPILNSVFLGAGFGAGLDCAIINPMSKEVMEVVSGFRVLNNQDRDAKKYIEIFSQVQAEKKIENGEKTLIDCIVEGRKDEARAKTVNMLKEVSPLEIIDGHFVPALEKVGASYEKGLIFLPQLIQSAEAVKGGFEVLAEQMPKDKSSKGKIVIATVVGDIHDIGKNIVKMLLENYGYEVIDLGKDVPIKDVVRATIESGAALVGLSALMTTTVVGMKDTISALKDAGCKAKVMVGGAVLNQDYLEFVGADYYAKDAREAVIIAGKVFGK